GAGSRRAGPGGGRRGREVAGAQGTPPRAGVSTRDGYGPLRPLLTVLGALALLLALPDSAWAFGPATHAFLGQHLLDALHLLPDTVAALLRMHPQSFLYGSLAADISL